MLSVVEACVFAVHPSTTLGMTLHKNEEAVITDTHMLL